MVKIILDCFGTLIDTGASSVNAAGIILNNIGSNLDKTEFYSEWKALKKEMIFLR